MSTVLVLQIDKVWTDFYPCDELPSTIWHTYSAIGPTNSIMRHCLFRVTCRMVHINPPGKDGHMFPLLGIKFP